MFSVWGSSVNGVCTCCCSTGQRVVCQKPTARHIRVWTFLCLRHRVTFSVWNPTRKGFSVSQAHLNIKLVGICRCELRLEKTERWRKSSASDEKKSFPRDKIPRSNFFDCWQSQRRLMFYSFIWITRGVSRVSPTHPLEKRITLQFTFRSQFDWFRWKARREHNQLLIDY